MKSKKVLATVLAATMVISSGAGALTVSAATSPETVDSSIESVDSIERYLSFENDQFILDTDSMLRDGYSEQAVAYISELYDEINVELSNVDRAELEREKERMLSEVGPTERGKLSAAVKVIKKFLKEKWPEIIKKLPGPVKTILSADAILAVIDAYVEISDSVEDLLTNCINAILPSSLEVLTPGVVAIIMLFLPI